MRQLFLSCVFVLVAMFSASTIQAANISNTMSEGQALEAVRHEVVTTSVEKQGDLLILVVVIDWYDMDGNYLGTSVDIYILP